MAGVATIAAVAGAASQQKSKNDAKQAEATNIYNQQNIAVNNRKNLLDQQLASRRAQLGAMGVSMDGSNQATQQKIVDEGYEDIENANSQYGYQYDKLKNQYYTDAMSFTSKVLI